MLDLQEAKDYLRLDGNDNDHIVTSILSSIPSYIELVTGLKEEEQDNEPMCKQVSKFILALWYNAEQTESDKLDKVISSLLKAITFKHDLKVE